jgi:GTP cyclohydrolase I
MREELSAAWLEVERATPQVHQLAVKQKRIEDAVRDLLDAIGEDVTRAGLRDTPKRVARFYIEFMEYNAGNTDTSFESVTSDQMVVVSDMRVWSLCEHHLLPFYCDVSVGYITHDKVLGLSKFARIAHKHAHRLTLQEQLVEDIAQDLKRILQHDDVAVIARGEHLCMTMRGIQTPHRMTSSSMSGVFRSEAETRQEFLRLTDGKQHT